MTTIPPGATRIDRRPLLVLWAAAMGARHTRDVQRLLELASSHTAHTWMRQTRDAGLVGFLDGRTSTLHPLYQIVWLSPENGAHWADRLPLPRAGHERNP